MYIHTYIHIHINMYIHKYIHNIRKLTHIHTYISVLIVGAVLFMQAD